MCKFNCSLCINACKKASTQTSKKHEGLEIVIPAIVSEKLAIAMEKLENPTKSPDAMNRFLTKSFKIVSENLPESVLETLFKVKNNILNPSYLHLKGLPIDKKLPPTPTDGTWSELKKTFVSEGILLGMGQLLGNPFGFVAEKDSKLLHQICPIPGKEEGSSSASSKKMLGWHTEIAFETALRPRFVSLICLRHDHLKIAATTLVDLRNVVKELPKWVIAELQKSNFVFKIPESFGGLLTKSLPKPILLGNDNLPEVVIDFNGMAIISKTKKALKAIEILKKKMDSNMVEIKLEIGDLLFIPNNYDCHGRSDYIPRYDGFDRWLQRIYLIDSLWAGRERMTENTQIYN